MPLPERTWTRRRLALAAAVILIGLVIVALVAGSFGDRGRPSDTAAPADEPRPLQIDTPPLPIPDPPLSRADLIGLAAHAASAHATGQPLKPEDAALVGRNFVVRIPFGCGGPIAAEATSGAHWRHDAAAGSITLRAYPEIWTDAAWVRALAGSMPFDAVEGFWLSRPWIASEDCPRPGSPAAEAAEAPAAAGEKTLGLAMFFAPNSSRVLRRGARPYEFVGKAPADGVPIAPKGFRLMLAGRIVGFSETEPVRCRSEGPSRRPVCLVAVAFDHVAFEDPAAGKTLAEWRTN